MTGAMTSRPTPPTTSLRVLPEEFRELPLEAHALLADVPLRDVTAIDLPGGGPGRTVSDLRALVSTEGILSASAAVRALFGIRRGLGRLFGWDTAKHDPLETSYLGRVPERLRARSRHPPGSADGPFRLLYLLEHESLAEAHNATVHAFICTALVPRRGGYRLYWGIYVKPTSRLTPVYMAMIEPFRRFVVYPAIFRRTREAWSAHYGAAESATR
jgi:hypothetical protein